MKLTQLFAHGTFVITSEVGPVKGAVSRDPAIEPACAREAGFLRHHVHAVNVTDNQSAVMRLGSLAASVGLKARGFEPVYQLACRDTRVRFHRSTVLRGADGIHRDTRGFRRVHVRCCLR